MPKVKSGSGSARKNDAGTGYNKLPGDTCWPKDGDRL